MTDQEIITGLDLRASAFGPTGPDGRCTMHEAEFTRTNEKGERSTFSLGVFDSTEAAQAALDSAAPDLVREVRRDMERAAGPELAAALVGLWNAYASGQQADKATRLAVLDALGKAGVR